MADFSDDFVYAFNHAMLYEVGRFWDPTDPDVIEGLYDTRDRRRKVGYVNIPSDRGGETKYGIAQKPNPEISVRDLNLEAAMDVYFHKYWLRSACDRLPYPLTIIHFDGCVNHGVGRGCRILQQALGVDDDGVIGRQTLEALEHTDVHSVVSRIADIRRTFYQNIVRRDLSQGMFLKGWMIRIDEVYNYTITHLD